MGTFGPGEEDRIGYVVSVGVKQDEVVDLLRGVALVAAISASQDRECYLRQICLCCRKNEAGGNVYHKLCFKCATCKMPLKLNNYQQNEGKLLCKTDYQKEILAKNAQICT